MFSPVAPSAPSIDLGGVTLTALLDAHGSFMSFRAAFPDADGELEQASRDDYPDLFNGDQWVLPFRAFTIRTPEATVVVDAGVGPPPGEFLPERQGLLQAELFAAGISAADVGLVVLTHLHVDHIGWTAIDGTPFFPRARYVTSAVDWRFFANRFESRATFAAKLAPLEGAGAVELIESPPTQLLDGISVLPTPGHTPGHLSVRVTGADATAVILGDVAVHPAQLREPTLGYAHDEDAAVAAATRQALLHQLAGAVVAAGHFPGAIGRVLPDSERWLWRPLG